MASRDNCIHCEHCYKEMRGAPRFCRTCEEVGLRDKEDWYTPNRDLSGRQLRSNWSLAMQYLATTVLKIASAVGSPSTAVLSLLVSHLVPGASTMITCGVLLCYAAVVVVITRVFKLLDEPGIKNQTKLQLFYFLTSGLKTKDIHQILRFCGVKRYPTRDSIRQARRSAKKSPSKCFEDMLKGIGCMHTIPRGKALSRKIIDAIEWVWFYFSTQVPYKSEYCVLYRRD